ncbi:helix-turn-helix transcriptional regulator [Acidovorax sp. SUPP1855]|uniref:helix-turn-helix domain-containing protein n=1 Tax=Acidovorax sp. SUPP1855 TaxID=431774 RepID=UPI0023DE67B1|nr:helix-turn-helix domain-containing protein [Acidovorax sp. SUPP1855]GKS85554.1 helix-turn-helix transcriptional regulator [Acidovorax sp. SUPP1855]
MIGERLREERERLGLTQPAFADAAGAKKRTLIDWEKGVSSPTAVQLSALAGIGVDVLYVLTGQSSQPATAPERLTPRQRALLNNYEHTSEEGKRIIEGTADLAAKSAAAGGRNKAA